VTLEFNAQIVAAGVAVVAPILTYFEVRALRRQRRLRARYRQALKDLRAFHEIEMRLCGAVIRSRGYEAGEKSELAVKRVYRLAIRVDGMESPSDLATPQRIAQELARLGS
jgi:hypothetical protein